MPRSAHPSESVAVGSQVVLDDLDEKTREVYVVVPSPESNPAEGRISDESPVGRAVVGHHAGDVVAVHVPDSVRHLRIDGVHRGRESFTVHEGRVRGRGRLPVGRAGRDG